MVVNNMSVKNANKILDRYTKRPISVATATKRLNTYNTNYYDLDFPFVMGKNIKYDPYLNRFVNVATLRQQKENK